MVKRNNVIPNGHFKKHWQGYVRTWFNRPARKQWRRVARQKKAVKIFPRPTAGPLRPIVQCQTRKYNMKSRAGRGFTLEELKAAGVPKKLAPTMGIAVDHRRKNRSLEGMQANIESLRTYMDELVIFPKKKGQFKAGDSTPEELASATQATGAYMPILPEKRTAELVEVTEKMKKFKAKIRVNKYEYLSSFIAGAKYERAALAWKDEKKKKKKKTKKKKNRTPSPSPEIPSRRQYNGVFL